MADIYNDNIDGYDVFDDDTDITFIAPITFQDDVTFQQQIIIEENSGAGYFTFKDDSNVDSAFFYYYNGELILGDTETLILSASSIIMDSASKTTPLDADTVYIKDTENNTEVRQTTWSNVKAFLKTYFDTLYQAVLISGTNIKTINGSSILGSGNLVVSGGVTMGDVYPVGSIYTSVVSTNPATLLGVGTWSAFGTGRTIVGIDTGDTNFDTVEETGGAKTHTLITAEIPSHTHVQDAHTHTQDAHTHTQDAHSHVQGVNSAITGGLSGYTPDTSTNTRVDSGYSTANTTAVNQNATATNQNTTATNQNTGGGGAHNNLQPYIVVYMWKRTA